ncbi:MAG TPA: hypothetical protein VN634_05030 [Candidatus Limnocylindrales bacterium]|nr:hypothetical protein [Candidatus Limnocylindrales bacterium]
MRLRSLAGISIASLALSAGSAHSQCAFDTGPARGFRTSMVRAYLPCPATFRDSPFANNQTVSGVDACSPVIPYVEHSAGTPYSFSAKGGCSVQTKVKVVSDCSQLNSSEGPSLNLPAGACHVTSVRSSCKGIMKASGNTPIDSTDAGWTLAVLSRASIDDPVGGDMTLIDVPMTFEFSTPDDGKISLDSTSAEALADILGTGDAALPPCTSMEILDIVIKDPTGLRFAAPGTATAQ